MDDIKELDAALPLMEKSLDYYRRLVNLTRDSYLYANSMQTSMRRIPIGGDDGKYKHWEEMLPVYEKEIVDFKKNIAMLKAKEAGTYTEKEEVIRSLKPAKVTLPKDVKTVTLKKGVRLFSDLDSVVTDYAPELDGLKAYVFSTNQQRQEAVKLDFTCDKNVTLLVGYFRDDQIKYAQAPKLEIDATANEYGQAEPAYTSAIRIDGMPQVNVHPYSFKPGHHTLLLPKGIILVLGYTSDKIKPREVGLSGADKAIDWLFY